MDNIIIFCAKYLIFIVGLICLGYWLTLDRKKKVDLAAAVIVAAVIAYILVKLGGKLYFHHRPFVVKHLKPLVSHGDDNGFPSEHTTFSTLAAVCVYYYNKKLGYGLLALAVIIGAARVAAHVHWPIDIIGGLVFGAVAAAAGYWLVGWAYDKKLLK